MAGERDVAGDDLRQMPGRDPGNAYYLWMAYGQR
jgi:hypothetical protein